MIIFDDILGSLEEKQKQMASENTFKWIAFNGRHLDIICIVLIQDLVGIQRPQVSNSRTLCTFADYDYYSRKEHLYPKMLITALQSLDETLLEASPSHLQKVCNILMSQLKKYECYVRIFDNDGKPLLFKFKAPYK